MRKTKSFTPKFQWFHNRGNNRIFILQTVREKECIYFEFVEYSYSKQLEKRSAPSHNFYFTLTFLHFCLRAPTNLSFLFCYDLFALTLGSPRHLAKPNKMHTNILNIPKPNISRYQGSSPPNIKIHFWALFFIAQAKFQQ